MFFVQYTAFEKFGNHCFKEPVKTSVFNEPVLANPNNLL